ncbi:DUF1844 domain-containing protein [Bdellovibrio svalbardensis]|uniref:DUF1844 domain-containing protein n=1 Tax=Bdellovibrio svalbardensis TaxID=2972972 RepID=A0ABT6DIS4_9BACT|nr:DUF1844 domain-containing protein [Bdellovibrio svalbardensis]MDG0815824.1 DUF1844 domain-containing protein [Bdellovibrio svalbardensis]
MQQEKMEASMSILIMSIASSAVMAMGLSPDPQTGQTSKDKQMARFNIDLLLVLQQKTKGNLTNDEAQFLENLISDLQIKYVSI